MYGYFALSTTTIQAIADTIVITKATISIIVIEKTSEITPDIKYASTQEMVTPIIYRACPRTASFLSMMPVI